MQKLKTTTLSIIIGLTFAAGITYATAVWNNREGCTDCGTTNITSGNVISAENIKANFEWLKERIQTNTSSVQTNTSNIQNISTGVGAPPVCTGEGKALQWDGGLWICDELIPLKRSCPAQEVGFCNTRGNIFSRGPSVPCVPPIATGWRGGFPLPSLEDGRVTLATRRRGDYYSGTSSNTSLFQCVDGTWMMIGTVESDSWTPSGN